MLLSRVAKIAGKQARRQAHSESIALYEYCRPYSCQLDVIKIPLTHYTNELYDRRECHRTPSETRRYSAMLVKAFKQILTGRQKQQMTID